MKQNNDTVAWVPLGEVLTKIKVKSVSAKKLKRMIKDDGNVRLLSTGNFDGWTDEITAGENLYEGEIITIPTGGTANLKYHNGKFVNSLNYCYTSKKVDVKYIYHFMLDKNNLIQSFFRGSNVQHPEMSKIMKLKIPIPLKKLTGGDND